MVVLIAGATALHAGTRIMASRLPESGVLEAYKQPGDGTAIEIPLKDVAFPIDVIATKDSFLQVEIGGREYWIDERDVDVEGDQVGGGASIKPRGVNPPSQAGSRGMGSGQ